MSYVAVDALLDRLSEVIGQSKGTLRTVPALRFDGNLPPGLSNAAERRRSMETPRYFSSVTALDRSPSSSPVMGNLLLYKITVEVRVVRLVPRLNQLDEGVHRAGQSQAVIDGDVLRQAIEFPNNLLTTEAGVATGLASGLLTYTGSRSRFVGAVNDGAQTLETLHTFWGTIRATPPVA